MLSPSGSVQGPVELQFLLKSWGLDWWTEALGVCAGKGSLEAGEDGHGGQGLAGGSRRRVKTPQGLVVPWGEEMARPACLEKRAH